MTQLVVLEGLLILPVEGNEIEHEQNNGKNEVQQQTLYTMRTNRLVRAYED